MNGSPDTAGQEFRRELARGERLLWSGRPRQGLRWRNSDLVTVPFSLLWGGFAFFWEYSAWTKKTPAIFQLFGIPFVLVGLYLIAGRFFADACQRARTWYAVTDQRILIISGLTGRELKSLTLRNLAEVTLREGSDGAGSIVFGPTGTTPAPWNSAARSGYGRRYAPPSFELLDNVRRVYDIIRNAQQQSARSDR